MRGLLRGSGEGCQALPGHVHHRAGRFLWCVRAANGPSTTRCRNDPMMSRNTCRRFSYIFGHCFAGGPALNMGEPVASAQECRRLCYELPNCASYTYDGANCGLRGSTDGTRFPCWQHCISLLCCSLPTQPCRGTFVRETRTSAACCGGVQAPAAPRKAQARSRVALPTARFFRRRAVICATTETKSYEVIKL